MRKRLLAAVAALALASLFLASTAATDTSRINSAAVVPGPVAPHIYGGTYPSSGTRIASVHYQDAFRCSATLIAPRWVMTAKHCLPESPSTNMRIIAKSIYPRPSGGEHRSVIERHAAPSGDIALLYLGSAVSDEYPHLADGFPPVASENYVYGWGRECPTCGWPSTRLKWATVEVTSIDTDIKDVYNGRGIEYKAAVGATNSGTTCQGDSGGGFFKDHGRERQVGVVSRSEYLGGGGCTDAHIVASTAYDPNENFIKNLCARCEWGSP